MAAQVPSRRGHRYHKVYEQTTCFKTPPPAAACARFRSALAKLCSFRSRARNALTKAFSRCSTPPLIQRNLCPLSFVDVPQPIYLSAMLGCFAPSTACSSPMTIADVVRQAMNKAKAVAFIRHCANAKLPAHDRERFVEVVETQLLSPRPSEIDAWQTVWQ